MSSLPHPSFGAQPFRPVHITDMSVGQRLGRYMAYKPVANPHILQNGTQAAPVGLNTLPTAVQDNVDSIVLPEAFGNRYLEMYQTTAQTLMPNVNVDRTKGLEIGLDQVNNESVEYVPGGNAAANPFSCLVGTDPGVFIRAIFEFPNSDGTDQFIIGFRKRENYVVPTSFLSGGAAGYTDFAAIGFAATVAIPNPITVVTSVGSAVNVATATGFTLADGGVIQLEVRVKGGVVSYLINGVKLGDTVAKDGLSAAITGVPTVTPPAYSFTAGLRIIPFIFCRQDAGLTTAFISNRHATRPGLVVGQLLEDGLSPESRPVSFGQPM